MTTKREVLTISGHSPDKVQLKYRQYPSWWPFWPMKGKWFGLAETDGCDDMSKERAEYMKSQALQNGVIRSLRNSIDVHPILDIDEEEV